MGVLYSPWHTKSLLGVPLDFGNALNDRLIAEYAFNEAGGDTAYDGAGGVPATLTGATWTAGVLSFDGNDHVDTNRVIIPATGDFTIAGSINTSVTGQEGLVGQYTAGQAGRMILYGTYDALADHARLFINGANPSTTVLESQIATNDGLWHRILITRSGTAFKMYIDGVLEDESTTTATIYTGRNTHIGSADGTNQPFDGFVDQVSIYLRALNAAEAMQDYINTWQRYEPDLIPIEVAAANDLLLLQNINLRGNLQDLRGGLR